nr:immunoglobulin light chain junction region [Macaca mulatta]MOW73990.1 immunoglobulin light chain junction region [Macaca mulatta]MOW74657.1 immunoglobulin light chain junction region [Macaca mulatta]
CLQRSNWPFTF